MSQPRLGEQVRALRMAKGYTIGQVATLSGMSKSFISMLENGHTNISATRLQRLASLFGLQASDLLPDPASQALVQVVRSGEGAPIRGFGSGAEAQLLSKDLHRRIQPVLLSLGPGARHTNETGHAGEEFIYILSGEIRLQVGNGEPVALRAGDSAYYPSALSHSYVNSSREVTRLLTISTPPKLL